MGKLPVLALRAVIVALLACSLFVQILFVAINARELDADLATMRHPYLLIAILVLGLVAFQVVLVCVWRLLTMVRRGTVFSHAAFRYVGIVIGAIVAAAVLMIAVMVVQPPGEDFPPGLLIMIGGVIVATLGVALVVLVLRMLLAQATRLQADLDDVI